MPSSSCSFQLKHTHIHHPPLPSNHPNHPLLQSSQFRSLFRAILYRSLIQKQEKPWSLASKAPEEKTISLRFWQHWLLLSSPSSSSSASPLLGSKAMPHKGIFFFFFCLHCIFKSIPDLYQMRWVTTTKSFLPSFKRSAVIAAIKNINTALTYWRARILVIWEPSVMPALCSSDGANAH